MLLGCRLRLARTSFGWIEMTVYSLFGAVEYGALSAIYGSNLYLSTPELNQNAVRLIWNSISCQVELVLPQFLPIAYRGFLIPSPPRVDAVFFHSTSFSCYRFLLTHSNIFCVQFSWCYFPFFYASSSASSIQFGSVKILKRWLFLRVVIFFTLSNLAQQNVPLYHRM